VANIFRATAIFVNFSKGFAIYVDTNTERASS